MRTIPPLGLRPRLALAFSLLSVVLTLALLALVERRAVGQLEQQIGAALADLAAQTSDKLERGMFERYREVALIADRPSLADPAYGVERLTRTLRRVQETYSYYEWIGVTDAYGKVKATGNGLLVGADVSARPWFRQGLEGGYAGDVHEAKLLAKLLPPQAEPRRFVDVAFPYVDAAGKVQGVLGAHLSWTWARDVERSVVGATANTQLQGLIVDAAGRVLLGPGALEGQVLDLDSIRLARTTQRRGHLVERWPDGRQYLVGYQKGAGHASYPGLGWTVLVREDLAHAYAPVRALRDYVLWSGAALALLFSLVGVWVARSITRPLARLADAATKLRQGGTTPIEARPDDYAEIRALGRALNALVSDLDTRRGQQEQLNATLEQQVELRTRELRHALETVQASEARIRAIVETAQDAFVGVDLHGRIVDWNRQAEALLGWRREEAIGHDLAQLIRLDQLREAAGGALADFAGAAHSGGPAAAERRVERVVTDRHGAEIPVEMSTGLTGQGDAAVFSIFLRDITERKRIERMKNEFVGTVSHELRTPLTSIRASLALLADGALGALPPDVLELVEICNSNCVRLNRLVDDMLDIQKIEAGMMSFAPKRQALLPLAREAVRTMRGMAGAGGVTLELEVADGAETLEASFDLDRMTQVLVNLLSNAIRVAPVGTQVVVGLGAQATGAFLSVADSGPGIAPELRERVFQPFVQIGERGAGPKGGTGLGLAICKRIVEEHGGTITIGDAPGGGAVFRVTLPA